MIQHHSTTSSRFVIPPFQKISHKLSILLPSSQVTIVLLYSLSLFQTYFVYLPPPILIMLSDDRSPDNVLSTVIRLMSGHFSIICDFVISPYVFLISSATRSGFESPLVTKVSTLSEKSLYAATTTPNMYRTKGT